MESVRPATPMAALHYRALQRLLLQSKRNGRNPRKVVDLSHKVILELHWWVLKSGFAGNSSSPIRELIPTVNI